MEIDETQMSTLLEESQDTHADAMRSAKVELDEFVEVGLERRAARGTDPDEGAPAGADRALVGRRLAMAGAAAGVGAAVFALSGAVAGAATASDVAILQT